MCWSREWSFIVVHRLPTGTAPDPTIEHDRTQEGQEGDDMSRRGRERSFSSDIKGVKKAHDASIVESHLHVSITPELLI